MENKRYIVAVRGMLKFENGKKIESGKFVPKTTPKEELESKLEKKQIIEFDPKSAAAVQGSNKDSAALHKEIDGLNKKIDELRKENESLAFENSEVYKANAELKIQIEELKKKAKK